MVCCDESLPCSSALCWLDNDNDKDRLSFPNGANGHLFGLSLFFLFFDIASHEQDVDVDEKDKKDDV